MSADPILYCLENLTDYRQFERLCTDIMSLSGYPDIEPIGGTGDGGRDAIHVSKVCGTTSIFAYSVRADWETKLFQDCERIRQLNHHPDCVIFACTASVNATERDRVIERAKDDYGWGLELHPIERLRVQLAGPLQSLLAQHPSIFCPPVYPRKGGQSISPSRDLIVLDHMQSDHAMATWLSRRLQQLGYRVWCLGTAPMAGENQDETVRALIELRAERYLPVLSASSVRDPDFLARVTYAASFHDLVIPCDATTLDTTPLPRRILERSRASFSESWAIGLKELSKSLAGSGVAPRNDPGIGAINAVRSYIPVEVVKATPETVYANCFPLTVPSRVRVTRTANAMRKLDLEKLADDWAFIVADARTLLSFASPPNKLPTQKSDDAAGFNWSESDYKFEMPTASIVKQLARKSLELVCKRAGMQWCDHRRAYFFPDAKAQVPLVHVDGRKTTVNLNGKRTVGSGDYAKQRLYQLCPAFRIGVDTSGDWWLTLRLYARVTDSDGLPLEGKEIGRTRKAVGRSWWNHHWLARTLGMVQALAQGSDAIEIGEDDELVSVSIAPLQWECPVAIDYRAVERIGDYQAEFAQMKALPDDDDLDEADETTEATQDE